MEEIKKLSDYNPAIIIETKPKENDIFRIVIVSFVLVILALLSFYIVENEAFEIDQVPPVKVFDN